MLAAFAERVRVDGIGPVADLGCGPGRLTAHLVELGVPAFGIDLSPKMITLAKRLHPRLEFAVGSMDVLPLPDNELGGILAMCSIHHLPPNRLPRVFAEFARVLAPGGRLLLWTHCGEHERLCPTEAYGGHPVSYRSYLLPAEVIAGLLGAAGLAVSARLTLAPGENANRSQACFVVDKPVITR